MLVLNRCHCPSIYPIDVLDFGGWVVALSSELALLDMVSRDEVSFSRGPVREFVMHDLARVGKNAKVHNFIVDLAELNEAETVLLERLIVLSKLCHVKCELIVC